jgi:hypothetical protein
MGTFMRFLGYATVAAAVAMSVAHTLPAAAAQFDVTYTGIVTQPVTTSDYTFSDTTTFTLTFRINDASPDLEPGDVNYGAYEPISNFSGAFSNGYTFTAGAPGPLAVGNSNTPGSDYVDLSTVLVSGPALDGYPFYWFSSAFYGSMLSSDAIPDMASLLSLSDANGFDLLFGDNYEIQVVGVFTGASETRVGVTPIPTTLPLFASALGGLGVTAWRRRKRQVC